MFNNPFLKKDPLLEAVKSAQADGAIRRQAEALVNEEFGVYSRKAVVREQLAAYDAALEAKYTDLKEGNFETDSFGTKMTNTGHPNVSHPTSDVSYKATTDRMKSGEKAYNPHGTDIKEAKKADKDYDKDGKIESGKAEYQGSRIRAAKLAGKLEELKDSTLKSYVDKSKKELKDTKDQTGVLDKDRRGTKNRLQGIGMASVKLAKEETQIDELKKSTLASYVGKAANANYGKEKLEREKGVNLAMRKIAGGARVKGTNEGLDVVKRDPSVQGSGDVSRSPKGYEDPSTPKVPYSELPKTGNRAGSVIDSAKGALKESIIAKLHTKHMKEDSSFNAALETGKSVREAVDAAPTSWVNQPNPGVHRAASRSGVERMQNNTFYRGMRAEPQSTKGTGRLLSPQTARATGPAAKTGTSLVPSGSRAPTVSAGGGSKPPAVPGGGTSASAGGSNVPATRASGSVTAKPGGGSGFSYTKGPSTPGVNAPNAFTDKIRGGDPIKSVVKSAGVGSAVKNALGATVKTVAKVASNPVIGGIAAAMDPTPANQGENEFARQAKYGAKAKEAPASPKPAAAPAAKPTVKQSFSQAFKAARETGGSKAQFNWTDKSGKTGTYQAAATKKEYVPSSQQKPVDSTPKVPTPPERPKDLTPSADSAKKFFGNFGPETKPAKSPQTPEVRNMATQSTDNTIPGSDAKPVQTGKFEKNPKSVQESVQVGDNKYRIV